MYRLSLAIAALIVLAACGGTTGSSTSVGAQGRTANSSSPGQYTAVGVTSGTSTTGVDIGVTAPVGTAPNAQSLGSSVAGNYAFGTGAQIRPGETSTVFLFGAGLSGNMQVRISGPSDINVSNIASASGRSSGSGTVTGISSLTYPISLSGYQTF